MELNVVYAVIFLLLVSIACWGVKGMFMGKRGLNRSWRGASGACGHLWVFLEALLSSQSDCLKAAVEHSLAGGEITLILGAHSQLTAR